MRVADGEIFIKIFNLEINWRGFKTMTGKKQMKKRILKWSRKFKPITFSMLVPVYILFFFYTELQA